MEILYRSLELDECSRIREIDASQYIGRAWRDVNGTKELVVINYQDPDFPNGSENHLANLINTITSQGIALGAFYENQLIGFCSINNGFFGEKSKYLLLDQLFISKELRGKGIGKTLFYEGCKIAKENGAEKIYICAGSSEETIAFYFAVGCQEAIEINQDLYQLDTRDYQLEYDLSFM